MPEVGAYEAKTQFVRDCGTQILIAFVADASMTFWSSPIRSSAKKQHDHRLWIYEMREMAGDFGGEAHV